MPFAVVRPNDAVKAVGYAVTTLAADLRYFRAELGLVVPRLVAAAERGQLVLILDETQRDVLGFAAVAFLDPNAAFEWRHRRRAPSHNDFKSGTNAWLTDYSWPSVEAAKAVVGFIRQQWPGMSKVQLHLEKTDYPLFDITTLDDRDD